MTSTPNYPWDDQIGRFVVWVVCTGPDQNDCYNFYPHEYTESGTPTTSWGSAVAGFDSVHELIGYRVTPLLIERYPNPNWNDGGYDPGDSNTWPNILERVVTTYTESIVIDTDQRDQIHPNIELFDGDEGATSVAGIIDGTYYIYPVVFQDAKFCYLPRCSGTGSNYTGEICAFSKPMPLEPYYPECNPPVLPMDAITSWVPSSRTQELITYSATWNYYVGEQGDPYFEEPSTDTINLEMIVYAPSNDWGAMLNSYIKTYTYFGNGIYH
jgi:hypothetical protein